MSKVPEDSVPRVDVGLVMQRQDLINPDPQFLSNYPQYQPVRITFKSEALETTMYRQDQFYKIIKDFINAAEQKLPEDQRALANTGREIWQGNTREWHVDAHPERLYSTLSEVFSGTDLGSWQVMPSKIEDPYAPLGEALHIILYNPR